MASVCGVPGSVDLFVTYRRGVVECSVEYPTTSLDDKFIVLRGGKYIHNGRITFHTMEPTDKKRDKTYSTVFGPCADHRGVVYGNTPNNLSRAATRLFAIRDGEKELRANQRNFVANNIYFLFRLRLYLTNRAVDYSSALEECEAHIHDVHAKRVLREKAFEERINNASLLDTDWRARWSGSTHDTDFQCKIKTGEVARPGKHPRTIVNLGVDASLQGYRLTHILKAALTTFTHLDLTLHFCHGPTDECMDEALDLLLNPPTRCCLVYFSDDSCVSIRTSQGIKIYNMDISKCDASHTIDLFNALRVITPTAYLSDMDVLVRQCTSPISIKNPYNSREEILLQPREPTLYSGSTLTTLINNLATMLIGLSICLSRAESVEEITAAARIAGYVVTLEPTPQIEDIQFLKHSPVRCNDGAYKFVLNFGVLLRAYGVCRGDLPGRGDLESRAKRFNNSLVHSAYPRVNTDLINCMKTLADDASAKSVFSYKVDQNTTGRVVHCSTYNFLKRYKLTYEMECHLRAFCTSQVNTVHNTAGLRAILLKDYGLDLCGEW